MKLKPKKPYMVSLLLDESGCAGTAFQIDIRPHSHSNLIIGEVIQGRQVVDQIQAECGPSADKDGKPSKKVQITKCGEITMTSISKAFTSRGLSPTLNSVSSS